MEKYYNVDGMVCSNCAKKIQQALEGHDAIDRVTLSYPERTLSIVYKNQWSLSLNDLNALVVDLGYEIRSSKSKAHYLSLHLSLLTIIGFLLLSRQLGFSLNAEITDNMSLMMLFVAGVLTSFHCIAMCGGIALSQTVSINETSHQRMLRAVKYNMGRVISYSVLGAIIGALGSTLSLGGNFRGLVSILAGVFMIILSLNLMGIAKIRFPGLSYKKHHKIPKGQGPFLVGLANGFMPCGPLQTMQIYALGTGSALAGMSAMFFFSLGTVPLMLGFGVMTSFIGAKNGRRFVKASSVVVLVLGLIMINRGMLLAGYGVSLSSNSPAPTIASKEAETTVANNPVPDSTKEPQIANTKESVAEKETSMLPPYQLTDNVQIIRMTIQSDSYHLSSPLVAGIPSRIELDIESINRCNSPILIPKENITVDLLKDEPVITFTPKESGELRVTCWMGMITTNLQIVDSL